MHHSLKIRSILLSILLVGVISPHLWADSEAKRPNIIIIYVDDLARGDVGAFGCPDPGTENIDSLAKNGIRLTNAYTHNAPAQVAPL